MVIAKTINPFKAILTLLFCLLSLDLSARPRIAVLDFELKDLTLKPAIPAETARTASLKPLLENELEKLGFQIIPIPAGVQQHANAGRGYLFDHNDAAALLAEKYGADYVLAGRLHKPSFLFVYLMAHLIRVNNAKLEGDYLTEIKGNDKKLTLKGVANIAGKINKTLNP